MNLYRLFTSRGAQYWVTAWSVDPAIAKIEHMTGDRVSCWFIGGSLPANVTPITA